MSLLAKIRAQFEKDGAGAAAPTRAGAVRLATAALLVETMRADFDATAVERGVLVDLLERHFGLTGAEADDLVAEAERAAEKSVSLYEFTRVLNDGLAPGEKLDVVELLWRTCLADGRLDHYEDHLVGKVAELLHVSRSDVIRLRNLVRGG
ncbi:MAG: TerB family tellurite resistance protein [Steroidobacteraceae bacterium]|jgi:uncharacterized tellurite resistance protein B-like protein|nr:TerB family tellurite resistance protein [Steroidobacteraceae bacterium]